jgi:ribonuclease HI
MLAARGARIARWPGLNVSVFADASWCHRTGAGGWGGWAKSNRKTVADGGQLLGAASSGEAEAMAAANAVWLAFARGVASHGDRLVIATDCEAVVRLLNLRSPRTPAETLALDYVASVCAARNATFEARHVKGHRPWLGRRNWVNDLCDGLARGGMERARSTRKRRPFTRKRPRVVNIASPRA